MKDLAKIEVLNGMHVLTYKGDVLPMQGNSIVKQDCTGSKGQVIATIEIVCEIGYDVSEIENEKEIKENFTEIMNNLKTSNTELRGVIYELEKKLAKKQSMPKPKNSWFKRFFKDKYVAFKVRGTELKNVLSKSREK